MRRKVIVIAATLHEVAATWSVAVLAALQVAPPRISSVRSSRRVHGGDWMDFRCVPVIMASIFAHSKGLQPEMSHEKVPLGLLGLLRQM